MLFQRLNYTYTNNEKLNLTYLYRSQIKIKCGHNKFTNFDL